AKYARQCGQSESRVDSPFGLYDTLLPIRPPQPRLVRMPHFPFPLRSSRSRRFPREDHDPDPDRSESEKDRQENYNSHNRPAQVAADQVQAAGSKGKDRQAEQEQTTSLQFVLRGHFASVPFSTLARLLTIITDQTRNRWYVYGRRSTGETRVPSRHA